MARSRNISSFRRSPKGGRWDGVAEKQGVFWTYVILTSETMFVSPLSDVHSQLRVEAKLRDGI